MRIVSHHIFLEWVLNLWRERTWRIWWPWVFFIQFYSPFGIPVANFRRSPSKSYPADCKFLIATHGAVLSEDWNSEFCLWWGFGKSLTYIRKSNRLGTKPCGTPAMGLILSERKPFTLAWITRKLESQRVILVGRSRIQILHLSPLCQTLSKTFSTSRKTATTCSPLLKLSITEWESLEEMIIGRLILFETWLTDTYLWSLCLPDKSVAFVQSPVRTVS